MELRPRSVACEIKASQDRAGVLRDDVFSATPPHEAVRVLLSLAMAGMSSGEESNILLIDISHAHFHSPARRTIYIDLIAERRVEGCCGVLNQIMYGTRDVAANFASLVMQVLGQLEFAVGVYDPCFAKHRALEIVLFYHKDDFVMKGFSSDLKWFAAELGKELIIKARGSLGTGPGEVPEIVLLNRIIAYGRDEDDTPFLHMEADPWHVAIVVATLGLKDEANVKAVSTLGAKRTSEDITGAAELRRAVSDFFWSVCMRINYVLCLGQVGVALQRRRIGETHVEAHFSLVGHGEPHWGGSPPMPEDCSAHDHAAEAGRDG